MLIFHSICPVPFDQRPLNEYKSLTKLTLFSWSLMQTKNFVTSILCIIFVTACCSIILTSQYSSNIIPKRLLYVYNLSVTTLIIELVLVRLYLGWSYVSKRLLSASVTYEESGWYDNQIWIKSASSLIQDRLVAIYEVNPLLAKIKKLVFVIALILCLETVLVTILN